MHPTLHFTHLQYSCFSAGGFHPGSPLTPLTHRFFFIFVSFFPPFFDICSTYFSDRFLDAFLVVFWTILGSILDLFSVMVASFFGHLFCLLFTRTVFGNVLIVGPLNLEKTLYFPTKNVISEKRPLQNRFEKSRFLERNPGLFWVVFKCVFTFFRLLFSHRFLDALFDQKKVQK